MPTKAHQAVYDKAGLPEEERAAKWLERHHWTSVWHHKHRQDWHKSSCFCNSTASSEYRLKGFLNSYSNFCFSWNRWLDCFFFNSYRIWFSAVRAVYFASPDFLKFLLISGHKHHPVRHVAGFLKSTNAYTLDHRLPMIIIDGNSESPLFFACDFDRNLEINEYLDFAGPRGDA
jgi:hypothetical protein